MSRKPWKYSGNCRIIRKLWNKQESSEETQNRPLSLAVSEKETQNRPLLFRVSCLIVFNCNGPAGNVKCKLSKKSEKSNNLPNCTKFIDNSVLNDIIVTSNR